MTPKEQADELFNKMLKKMPHPDVTNANVYSISRGCAIVACLAVLRALQLIETDNGSYLHWEQVRKELEKL